MRGLSFRNEALQDIQARWAGTGWQCFRKSQGSWFTTLQQDPHFADRRPAEGGEPLDLEADATSHSQTGKTAPKQPDRIHRHRFKSRPGPPGPRPGHRSRAAGVVAGQRPPVPCREEATQGLPVAWRGSFEGPVLAGPSVAASTGSALACTDRRSQPRCRTPGRV